jgi:hypothetical protein
MTPERVGASAFSTALRSLSSALRDASRSEDLPGTVMVIPAIRRLNLPNCGAAMQNVL